MIPAQAVEAARQVAFERYGTKPDAAYLRTILEAAAPHTMASEVRRVRESNDHIKEGSGAYSSGFHFALDCIYLCNENGDAL